jgi:hypothetical protein
MRYSRDESRLYRLAAAWTGSDAGYDADTPYGMERNRAARSGAEPGPRSRRGARAQIVDGMGDPRGR